MPSLHWHLPFLCVLFLSTLSSWAQQPLPFGSGFAPTFSFTEYYMESAEYSDDEADFVDTTSYSLTFNAKASMNGINSATFQNDSLVLTVVIGNLDLSLPFSEGTRSIVAGQRSIKWTLEGFDPNTYDDLPHAGTVELRYDDEKLTVSFSLTDAWDDYSITAPDQAGFKETLSFPLQLDFTVGPYGFSGRVVYVNGTADLYDLQVTHGNQAMTFTDLAKVSLTGAIDSTKPSVLITTPIEGQTVSEPTLTVSGLAADDHTIQSVSVRVNTGDFVPAILSPGSTWSLADVALRPGDNFLVARAVDADGNTSDSGIRTVRYLVISPLTVNAAGDGSGRILSGFFEPIQYVPGQPSPSRTSQHAAGEQLVIVATAGPDAVFDGWTSNYPLLPNQAASPTLSFEMQPDMTLTAHFLRNPFVPVTGRYSGLIQSVDPSDRGVVSGTLTAEGGFSLVASGTDERSHPVNRLPSPRAAGRGKG